MEKNYLHTSYETDLYQKWEDGGYFNPDHQKKSATQTKNKTFTIMMPPPNANDPLHIGHAMFVALEDILIRYHRMLGDETLWLPGTDHAGIETQFVFERKLKKNNQSRFQFDRETLYKMIWDYVQENSNTAVNQLKKIGASADWSRFTFMLDPKLVDVVLETFQELNQKGMVYRDHRLVNYCTRCGTAFSELEVMHREEVAPLYYMKYGPFTIVTARPETKFRDTALAAQPDDPRYKEWMGKTLQIPGLLGPISMTVIADEEVDPEFGTGIMKVTPAHDAHDFELGKKYNLPVTPIIDFQGRMDFSWFLNQKEIDPKYKARAEKYHGKKIAEARKLIVEDLKEDGLLVKIDEKYTHSVGVCYRCGTIIEPLPLPQFFIKVKPLTKKVLEALDKKEVNVYGAGHDKILRHWLNNLKDWNISRQIVWGIRMPIWYNIEKHPEIEVVFLIDGARIKGKVGQLLSPTNAQFKEWARTGTTDETLLQKAFTLEEISNGLQELHAPIEAEYQVSVTSPGPKYIQETDTFDTWFSSAQWPYATLMSKSESDFKRFYPTQVMETGYDILPFWVMRMLMMGIFKTGQVPFENVYLHGLARDEKGQKMSKSKGNVINPLTIIEKYGADALRMALVIRSSAGLDKSVGEADFKAMRNLTNKLWNASRFILMNLEQAKDAPQIPKKKVETSFAKRLDQVATDITQQLNDFKIGLAAETAYNEFWHWFCDECIEQTKQGDLSLSSLLKGLVTFLKLLHPFTPFVTEAIWQELRNTKNETLQQFLDSEMIIDSSWAK
jgi:valyl-tRNA synthetase